MAQIIIGTAGHIDHGKTALVKALTGIDADRLKEEKERGLTIDLGFAHWDRRATIIDVPGHEKFIRNMVAGVSTIDLVLFVIAADDGVMPQTREHLDILKVLQVKQGVIVVTKIDLVDAEWLALVQEDVRALVSDSFLQEAPLFPVSATTGSGIPKLKQHIETLFSQIEAKQDSGLFWLPVDRAFTVKGFGTVVTGTVLSGQIGVGDTLELLPRRVQSKVRGLQTHGEPVERVGTGDRAAINLQSIEKHAINRGDVLTAPEIFAPSQRFDGRLTLLESAPRPLKSRTRVRVHVGTAEIMARISLLDRENLPPGETAFVQLKLEAPAAARRRDPFVVRQYSPTFTIGGGIILEPDAPRHGRGDSTVIERLLVLEKEDPRDVVEGKLLSADFVPHSATELAATLSIPKSEISDILNELAQQNRIVVLQKSGQKAAVHKKHMDALCARITQALTTFHQRHPSRPGMPKSDLLKQVDLKNAEAIFENALDHLMALGEVHEQGGLIRLQDHEMTLSPEQQQLRKRIADLLLESGFATPSEADMAKQLNLPPREVRETLHLMISLGEVLRVEGDIYFHRDRVAEARQKVIAFLKKNKQMSVSEFKDLLGGASRKYAMPLLNHFDGSGITERTGDVRVLREG